MKRAAGMRSLQARVVRPPLSAAVDDTDGRICNCMIFDHAFAYAFVACTTLAVSAAAAAAAAAAMCVP